MSPRLFSAFRGLTSRERPLPLWVAVLLAAVGGGVYDAAFPELGIWPLAFVGIGVVVVAQRGRGVWAGLLTGFVGGLTFYLLDVDWTALYLGPLPWIALAATEAAIWAVGGLGLTLAWRWVPRAFPTRLGRWGMLPLTLAGVWMLREYVADNWPYRGFAWGRAAESQSLSPFAPLVAWLGIAGVGFLMVWLVSLVLAVALEPVALRRTGLVGHASTRWRIALPALAVAVMLAVPAWPAHSDGSTRVAAVQGNGPAGYFEPHNPGDVENAQISATLPLLGEPPVSMVVWPEGAADVDPTRNTDSARVLTALSNALHAPLVIGTITQKGDDYFNSSLVWDGGHGATAQYDKQHPVPFGEYIPDRAFFHLIAPSLVDLIQRGYTAGTRPNTLSVAGVKAGISICFDIVDDWQLTQMMNGGAQLILAQTNNADFGKTKENEQQLAIARLRAIESSRALVNISTVGTSQIIGPTGATIASVPAYQPGLMTATVPLSNELTPAVFDASGLEWLVSALGLFGVAISGLATRRRKRS